MKKIVVTSFIFSFFVMNIQAQPLSLHPENPHYFMYNEKPLVLVTSAEHYGAVLNTAFDYKAYLQTLHREGMNYTRIFTGSYVEIPGSFGIENNTLAPAVGNYITPWKRVDEEGLYRGENKFDLTEWNPEYFERLRNFVALAEELDIIVEVTLFCSTYQDTYWERNPFNPENNINNLPDDLKRKESNTNHNENLSGFQKKMVEKIVTELNSFNNVFYEIQNEPWADNGVKVMRTLRTLDPNPGEGGWFKWAESATDESLEWQKIIAQTIVDTEKGLTKKHLVAQNYANFKHSLSDVDPNVDILNFHYAWPEAVTLNYGWNRPVVFDESGFAGTSDTTYLRQAWQFMLAGGAGFNNLDYSFFVGKEDGNGKNNAPGGGSAALREQLNHLHSFIRTFDIVKMKPDCSLVLHSPGMQWQAISETGKQYAIIFTGMEADWVKLNLPRGTYDYQFISPFTGERLKSGFFKHGKNEEVKLSFPQFTELVALGIKKR